MGWEVVEDQRAYEKVCQALREGAPELRRKLAAREIAAAALCLDSLGHHDEEAGEGRDEGTMGVRQDNDRRE